MKRIPDLRVNIKKAVSSEMSAIETTHDVTITPAAKRYIRSTASDVFKVNSPDIHRAGVVVVTPHKMGPKHRGAKHRGYAYLVAEVDPVVQAREAVRKVLAYAVQDNPTGIVKVSNVDSAISSQWCHVFPFCCVKTSIKLELPIEVGDLNENG